MPLQQVIGFSAMRHGKWEVFLSCGHSTVTHGCNLEQNEMVCHVCLERFRVFWSQQNDAGSHDDDDQEFF